MDWYQAQLAIAIMRIGVKELRLRQLHLIRQHLHTPHTPYAPLAICDLIRIDQIPDGIMTAISRPYILMWTIVGLFLTIGANFLPAYITSAPWQWLNGGVSVYPLGVKCQVGAVLLVSCLGGRTTGVLTQSIYLLLGLVWLKVFNDGGGIEYLQKPAFGYLLAFVPGSWVCGQLAFARPLRLEYLSLSCACGLVTIHIVGTIYLVFFQLINWSQLGGFKFFGLVLKYSIYPFPSQLLLASAATLIAFLLRKIMLY